MAALGENTRYMLCKHESVGPRTERPKRTLAVVVLLLRDTQTPDRCFSALQRKLSNIIFTRLTVFFLAE